MNARDIFTTVSATATAGTRYRSVTFMVTTHATGPDTAAARGEADVVLKKVLAAIERLNEEGAGIDMKGLTCTYAQQPWQEYDRQTNRHVSKGYQVTGSVVCSTERTDAATVIQDALSKIDGASVQQPSFEADDSYGSREAAFRAAYARAIEDFRMWCRTIGKNPDDYEVVGVDGNAPAHRGGSRVMVAALSAEAPASPPAEIKAGRAEIVAHVSLAFALRGGPTARGGSKRASAKSGATSTAAGNGRS